jgi:hypothetical protein
MNMRTIKIILFLVIAFFTNLTIQAQSIALKTNALNLLFTWPNLQAEFEIGKAQSITANLYKGNLNFLTETNWQGASLAYRKYFKFNQMGFTKVNDLHGLYFSIGYNLHQQILENRADEITSGPRFDFGHQWILRKNWLIDAGIGMAIHTNKTITEPSPRANISFGYLFRK